MLLELNENNGADKITQSLVLQCMNEFEGHLYGVEMGVAYGGGVQGIGQKWKDRGTVWGFDTFEGHPVDQMLARCEDSQRAGGDSSTAARCMDGWYSDTNKYGTERFKYEYIRAHLDQQGLSNVHLVKGLVTDQTDVSFIPALHYVLLDMDFPQAQWDGYNLVKDKIVSGGYLCLHDMIPQGHINGCWERYQQIMAEGLWELVSETPSAYLVVLKKK